MFGAGNVGASVTKLIGPWLIVAVPSLTVAGLTLDGWRFVPALYAVPLLVMAVAVWWGTPRLRGPCRVIPADREVEARRRRRAA